MVFFCFQLDPKSSPLALLAQTCSQIGADCSNSKALLPSLDRKKSSSANSNSSSDRSLSGSSITKSHSGHKSPDNKLAFKPYELNVLSRKSDSSRPPSSHTDSDDRKSSSRNSSRKSASASPHAASTPNEKSASSPPSSSSTVGSDVKPQTPVDVASTKSSTAIDPYASLKDTTASSPFKSPFSLSPLPNFGCNGCPTLPLDPTNPAFRSAFPNGHHLPHPSLLDPSCFQSSTPSPYMSYTRVKTPSGGETVVPVCKDPYCFSCRFTLHGAMGPCPPGCVQCDQKYNAAAAAMLMSNPFSAYHQYGRPFICNWMSGEQYCGKRFRNSDELLQHLRTHTSTTDPLALMNHLRYSSAIGPLAGSAAAAAVAAARYHPYSKPGALPTAPLGASPFSAFNPTLSPFYPPYSLYDQRIGAAVNP